MQSKSEPSRDALDAEGRTTVCRQKVDFQGPVGR